MQRITAGQFTPLGGVIGPAGRHLHGERDQVLCDQCRHVGYYWRFGCPTRGFASFKAGNTATSILKGE